MFNDHNHNWKRIQKRKRRKEWKKKESETDELKVKKVANFDRKPEEKEGEVEQSK